MVWAEIYRLRDFFERRLITEVLVQELYRPFNVLVVSCLLVAVLSHGLKDTEHNCISPPAVRRHIKATPAVKLMTPITVINRKTPCGPRFVFGCKTASNGTGGVSSESNSSVNVCASLFMAFSLLRLLSCATTIEVSKYGYG